MKKFTLLIAGVSCLVAVFFVAQLTRVNAVTAETQYSYDFTQTNNGIITNQASNNPSANLVLSGAWTQEGSGVRFDGNKVNMQSVGYAKPVGNNSSSTMVATQALGGGVEFTYDASKGVCASDSRNVTQIGRFATGASQLKIQFSSCSANKKATFVECRVVGSGAKSTDKPVRSTLALVHGEIYVATCARDVASGSSQPITLKVTPSSTGQAATNVFAYRNTGNFNATGYLSVANKYPLPTIPNNTDQFTGQVSKVVYCTAPTLSSVNSCLASW